MIKSYFRGKKKIYQLFIYELGILKYKIKCFNVKYYYEI